MAFRYLTRTIVMPVKASGNLIQNRHGAIVARAFDEVTAEALAQLINMGHPAALEAERQHEAREARLSRMFAASCKRSGAPATR